MMVFVDVQRDPNQIALAEKEIAEIKNLIEKEKEKKESWKVREIPFDLLAHPFSRL